MVLGVEGEALEDEAVAGVAVAFVEAGEVEEGAGRCILMIVSIHSY